MNEDGAQRITTRDGGDGFQRKWWLLEKEQPDTNTRSRHHHLKHHVLGVSPCRDRLSIYLCGLLSAAAIDDISGAGISVSFSPLLIPLKSATLHTSKYR